MSFFIDHLTYVPPLIPWTQHTVFPIWGRTHLSFPVFLYVEFGPSLTTRVFIINLLISFKPTLHLEPRIDLTFYWKMSCQNHIYHPLKHNYSIDSILREFCYWNVWFCFWMLCFYCFLERNCVNIFIYDRKAIPFSKHTTFYFIILKMLKLLHFTNQKWHLQRNRDCS